MKKIIMVLLSVLFFTNTYSQIKTPTSNVCFSPSNCDKSNWNDFWKIYDSVSYLNNIKILNYSFKGGFLNKGFNRIGNPFIDSAGNNLNYTLFKYWDLYTEWIKMDVSLIYDNDKRHIYTFTVDKEKLTICHMIKSIDNTSYELLLRSTGKDLQEFSSNPPVNTDSLNTVKSLQCLGKTKGGDRCRHMTYNKNGYCYQLQPKK